MSDRKSGEDEAKIILENKGFVFNSDYSDKGIEHSKPDLQYSNGRFLEVTHTEHNNKVIQSYTNYDMKTSLDKKYKDEIYCHEAYKRLISNDYSNTEEGLDKREKEKKFLKNHIGYDIEKGVFSEFNCDRIAVSYSIDNIKDVINKKSGKHNGKDIDLFIFVAEDEYRILNELLNGKISDNGFENCIINSSFKNIFVCSWNIEENKYEVNKPKLLQIKKTYMYRILN